MAMTSLCCHTEHILFQDCKRYEVCKSMHIIVRSLYATNCTIFEPRKYTCLICVYCEIFYLNQSQSENWCQLEFVWCL